MQANKFKSLKDFAKYVAFCVIDTNLMNNKKIPINFGWEITDLALLNIKDKDITDAIKKDRKGFNEMVLDRCCHIIDNMMTEDFFVVEDEEFLRLKTEEEIQAEIDQILAEDF